MSTSAGEKWALILGVSTGTGACIAEAIARDPGYKVVGFHRGNYPEDASALKQRIEGTGGTIELCVADAGDPDNLADCVEMVSDLIPASGIQLFVHSLSGASLGHFLNDREDAFHRKQFEKTFNYLAHSFPYWARALHEKGLLGEETRMLGLTNVLHDHMLHNTGLIAAAKAALETYVRYLSVELGRHGHRVNLLQFGTVVTPALRTVLGDGALKDLEEVHAEMIPAGRMCTVEEVAEFVVQLTRREATWFNGAMIDITGGMAQRLFDMVLKPD